MHGLIANVVVVAWCLELITIINYNWQGQFGFSVRQEPNVLLACWTLVSGLQGCCACLSVTETAIGLTSTLNYIRHDIGVMP